MKSILLTLILTVVFGGFVAQEANAQSDLQKLTVRVGKQKKASRSKLNIKFVELIEDSRCPEGTQCVWAGNAKIKIQISKSGSETKTLELNTNNGAKGGVFDEYVINLTGLTPTPAANVRLNRNAYTASLTVHRITR